MKKSFFEGLLSYQHIGNNTIETILIDLTIKMLM